MRVVTAAQMQTIDLQAQADFGITADELMLEAGRAIARRARQLFNPASVLILCGKGNNGGDGYVIAHELVMVGIEATVIRVDAEAALTGAAAKAFARLSGTRVRIGNLDQAEAELRACDLVIDALLGTGATGPAREPYATAIAAINRARRPVLAVDIPSGLQEKGHRDSSAVVQATVTVTIGLPKVALLSYPGVELAGQLIVEPINFPPLLLHNSPHEVEWATPADLGSWLPRRSSDANKGTLGTVGIIAGSAPYAGAALLVARAALRTGCGLAVIAATRHLNPVYKVGLPEAITLVLHTADPDWLDATELQLLLEKMGRASVLIIGPGLGTTPEQCRLVHGLLTRSSTPAVLDADALTCLAKDSTCAFAAKGRAATVLTPHPGELSRLLGVPVAEIQADRIGWARKAAAEIGVTVLLKGASTLVAEPTGRTHIVPGACAALAKGGTGDVLAGVIGSLMAQGAKTPEGAVVAAHAHLAAAQQYAQRNGTHGLLATELADLIPGALYSLATAVGSENPLIAPSG